MHSVVWEIQPTEKGNELSWWHFLSKNLKPASPFEVKMGFTVQLTDAISAIVAICNTFDPMCKTSLLHQKGLLFPSFGLRILAKKYDVVAEKIFAGGSSRERVFNYIVKVTINSPSSEIIKLFQKSYHELGPKPLRENVVFA